jgi:hypothetical protein
LRKYGGSLKRGCLPIGAILALRILRLSYIGFL